MRLTYKDLKNKRFGRLIAIKHIGSKGQGTKNPQFGNVFAIVEQKKQ